MPPSPSNNPWDHSNWQSGPVTFLQALGLKWKVQYPNFAPSMAAQQAASSSTASGGVAPGNPSGNIPNGKLSYAQLEQLWINAGGNPAKAALAAAVAMAESGGAQNASNNNTNGSQDRGYWQINTVHGSLSTFDPLGNARAAISISNNGADWSAWVTYNSGAYQKFLQNNVPPAGNPAPKPKSGGGGGKKTPNPQPGPSPKPGG